MKFIIIGLLISLSSFAETFKIAGSMVVFESQEGLLLQGCKNSCDALKKIKSFNKIDLKKARAVGGHHNSVGSDVCRLVYKANSVLGLAGNKDQRAFCIFEDKSLVEMNSLSQYLLKKKIVTE